MKRAKAKADADEVFAWDYGETGPQLPDDVGTWGCGVKENVNEADKRRTARTLRKIAKEV